MMRPRDCFFGLKRILIFIYIIYIIPIIRIYISYIVYIHRWFWNFGLVFFHRVWPDGCRVVETGFNMKPVGIIWARSQPSEGEADFSIGFDPMVVGLVRRDSVRSPSVWSELGLNRARAKLVLYHQVWPDGPRVGRWANGEKGNGRVHRHGNVCKLAEGALCLSKQ